DGADREPGEIVVSDRVHARHLSRFSPDEGAACGAAATGDALDDSGSRLDIQLAGGEVIEERQRLGALHDEIVDAHGDQVYADRVVPADGVGDPELRPDAVRCQDQERIAIAGAGEIEKAAEAAEAPVSSRASGRARQRLDALYQRIPGIDVDARRPI